MGSPKLRTTTSSATGTSTPISDGSGYPSTAFSSVAMPLRMDFTRQSSFPLSRFLATSSATFTGIFGSRTVSGRCSSNTRPNFLIFFNSRTSAPIAFFRRSSWIWAMRSSIFAMLCLRHEY